MTPRKSADGTATGSGESARVDPHSHPRHSRRQKQHRRPWRDRWLLLEAGAWLGLARLAVLTLPFKRIAPYLGVRMASAPQDLPDAWAEEARRVGWALRAMAPATPWRSNCLAQGIAGKAMLRRRGIPSTLYLGIAKGQGASESLTGHAWLRCASRSVTGAAGFERFTIIATFGDVV
jgi:hypothetical protein